ncbi:MAG: F0F1 ATP synthase subunit A [Bacteroidia bacterium]
MNTFFRSVIVLIFSLLVAIPAFAEDDCPCMDPEKDYDPGQEMMHHVLDAHDWHLLDYPIEPQPCAKEGEKCYGHFSIHLPWIVYSAEHGLEFYGSTHSLEESGKYEVSHDVVYLKGHAPHHNDAHGEEAHGEEAHAEEAHTDEAHAEVSHDEADHAHDAPAVYDFSPTKTVVQMFLVMLIAFFVFRAVAKGFQKNAGKAPKGVQSFFEPVITFIRDDVARNYLGDKAEKYTPYLLSLFFFIWFANLLGMTPFNSNIMGNISVTLVLSVFTFFLILINGTKDYWQHIFAMPGVPKAMWLLITPIEIFGMFIKPIALMIRLFANITAGHFMILALVSLIFILGKGGTNLAGSFGIMPLSVAFTIGIFMLEVIVGIIQAYVFTLLTAVFMGQALESHDHEHHVHHGEEDLPII